MCDKCQTSAATLLHIFELCPKLQPYWEEIFRTISVVRNDAREPNPVLVILNVSEVHKKLSKDSTFASLQPRK